MVVQACTHESFKKFGRNATGKQRLRCKLCGHTWLADAPMPLGDLRIGLLERLGMPRDHAARADPSNGSRN